MRRGFNVGHVQRPHPKLQGRDGMDAGAHADFDGGFAHQAVPHQGHRIAERLAVRRQFPNALLLPNADDDRAEHIMGQMVFLIMGGTHKADSRLL